MFHASRTRRSTPWAVLLAVLAAAALSACEDTVTVPLPPVPKGDFAFVTTTDFSSGSASVIGADSLLHVTKNVSPVYKDAVARYFDGRIYVINRLGGDNIQVLDPASHFATIKQFSVGNGSDPHDIVFESRSRAFVTRYNSDQMWIVDTNQGRHSGQISFQALADADGIPEMDHMVKVGNRVFVAVERLDRNNGWVPAGKSYVAVFDPNTEQFLDADPGTPGAQAITLAGTNPFGEMVFNPASGRIWVPCVGRYGVHDAGLELIDPATLTSSGIALSEDQAGGEITDVVPIDATHGAAIVSDANFNTLLIKFDLAAPASIDTLYAPGTFALQDAELSGGRIFVSDRTNVLPGVRVFRADTGAQITAQPIDTGLPPSDIEFTRGY